MTCYLQLGKTLIPFDTRKARKRYVLNTPMPSNVTPLFVKFEGNNLVCESTWQHTKFEGLQCENSFFTHTATKNSSLLRKERRANPYGYDIAAIRFGRQVARGNYTVFLTSI